MAVRKFLKRADGEGNLQEMTSSEMNAYTKYAIREFAKNPIVYMTVVSESGNLDEMTETFKMPGAAKSTSSSFPTPNDITIYSNTYDHLSENRQTQPTPVDNNNIAYPAYYNAEGNIQSCTLQDMIDTIYAPAIALLVSSTEDYTSVGGTYAVYRNGENPVNTTEVSTTNVFKDTISTNTYDTDEDVPFSSARSSATVQTENTWRLYEFNTPPAVSITVPIKIDSLGYQVKSFTQEEFRTMVQAGIRYTARHHSGSRIRYHINGNGTQKGHAMTDTAQTAERTINDQDADTYYSQKVPNGSVDVITTYYLRIETT